MKLTKILTLLTYCLFVWIPNNIAQNCSGSLNITLDGSSTGNPLTIEVDISNVTCSSEGNGSVDLNVLGSNPTYQFLWSDIIHNDSIRSNLSQGIYNVTVTDVLGCSETMTLEIQELSPNNTSIAMLDGCGTCVLGDAESSYFFNENSNYIASISDESNNMQALGITEVCMFRTDTVPVCDSTLYLQRYWSIEPLDSELACMKLYFTESEFENLIDAYSNGTTSIQQLIDEGLICLTAFKGGDEDCIDYESATIYSTADAPPLIIKKEDVGTDIWSVKVCTDEFASFYLHVCDVPKEVNLLYFVGVAVDETNVLEWLTSTEINTSHFELEKQNAQQDFTFLAKIEASGLASTSEEYAFVDTNPSELDNYRLKIVCFDGTFMYSNVVVIERELEEVPDILYPTIFQDEVFYEFVLLEPDNIEFTLFDAIGQTAYRENFQLGRGTHKLRFQFSHLEKGNYYLHVEKIIAKKWEAFKLTKHFEYD